MVPAASDGRAPAAVTGDPLNSEGFCAPTADRMVVGTSSNRMTPSHLVEDADRKLAVGLSATPTTPTPSQGRPVDGSPTSTTRTTASALARGRRRRRGRQPH